MHELLSFFVKHSKWLVFLLYAALSCILLFNSSPYQRHVYLTSANKVVAAVYGASNEVYSYFNLRKTNNDLNERNAELQAELVSLRQQYNDLRESALADSLGFDFPDPDRHFEFIVAHVISNSVARPYNYITINRGAAEGVRPGIGVIDQNGVVGIVNVVGEHSARIISVLNKQFLLSCKIKGNESFGTLSWEGDSPEIALLQELPRHTSFAPGDTVVTSGFSNVFPEGVPVGVVLDDAGHKNDNFFTLRVKLFTDFATLSNVQVVVNNQIDELSALELSDYQPK